MLASHYYQGKIEAGCDEAGRGCLAGSVYAAAVIFPEDYQNEELNDSKQLTDRKRHELRAIIVDGNRFRPYVDSSRTAGDAVQNAPSPLPHTCIVKGDGKYLSIAAASILAKTYRDDYMDELAEQYPQYDWKSNKGYPTRKHRDAIRQYGVTPYHRMSYHLLPTEELSLDFK